MLPQVRFAIDSNNQLDKSFEDGSNNLFENLVLNTKLTPPSPLVNSYMILEQQERYLQIGSLFDAKRAEPSTMIDLIYRSVISYINVSAYTILPIQ